MIITDEEQQMLKYRRTLTRYWKYAGSFLVIILAAFISWLYWKVPSFLDPWRMVKRIESGNISETSILLQASLVPLLFIAVLLLLACLIIFSFYMISREKMYLEIIGRFSEKD